MTEKKQKVLAGEYFKNSALFKADILAGLDNSANSSNVVYSLTCKKCHNVAERKGNSRGLHVCKCCKREWNREDDTIVEPVKGGSTRKSPRLASKVEASSDEEEEPVKKKITKKSVKVVEAPTDVEEEPVKKKITKKTAKVVEAPTDVEEEPVKKKVTKKVAKKVEKKASKKSVKDESESEDEEDDVADTIPPHDVDILAKILTGEIKPKSAQAKPKKLKQELKDDEHWVEQILDYYDGYEDDRWYRFYYVKWWEDDKNTFIRSDKFTDNKMVDEYESNLPTVERFRNVFPNPKISKRTAKTKIGYRTKADVEKAMEDDEEVVEEPTREQLQVDVVYMKAGERYFDLKSKTLFLLEGDKDNDKVMITLI